MYLKDALADEINIEFQNRHFYQVVDYVGMLFRHACFHAYGHLACDCTLKFTNKVWRRKYLTTQGHVKDFIASLQKDEKTHNEMVARREAPGVGGPLEDFIRENPILKNDISIPIERASFSLLP
jgi:hypothetical protein